PTASYPWVQSVLSYTLLRIPADKVSLGIPFYAWDRDNKTGALAQILTYPAVMKTLSAKGVKIVSQGWSDSLGSSYPVYTKKKKSHTVWYEDEKSFEQKLALVNDDKLHGFSAWAIGQEDPKDWTAWNSVVAERNPNGTGLALRQ